MDLCISNSIDILSEGVKNGSCKIYYDTRKLKITILFEEDIEFSKITFKNVEGPIVDRIRVVLNKHTTLSESQIIEEFSGLTCDSNCTIVISYRYDKFEYLSGSRLVPTPELSNFTLKSKNSNLIIVCYTRIGIGKSLHYTHCKNGKVQTFSFISKEAFLNVLSLLKENGICLADTYDPIIYSTTEADTLDISHKSFTREPSPDLASPKIIDTVRREFTR
jgi:hypothetical protein